MKKVLTYLMVFTLMMMSACNQRSGSGNLLTEVRKVENFGGIIVSGEMSVTITHSDKYEVKVTADDNLIKHVNTKVKSGFLCITCSRQPEESDISISVAMPNIHSIETEGNVGVDIKEGFRVNNLEIRSFGSGNIDINGITATSAIKILNRGSGNISLTGNAKLFSCVTRDAGNVFADMLDAEEAVAKVGGSGSIFVKTSGKLNVIVAGSGSVFYNGKPSMISKYITGSGSVKQRM
ncbi:MAG: DUF2807 domain-containing protein [Bacteroidales bacterium]|nr:DUF2807 domain-containing protein [Bacteroidales bacterium]